MEPDRLAAPPGNLSLLGMAVISGMLTIILMLTQVTSKVSPHTSTGILLRTPFPPTMRFTLHRQQNPKQKQDLHLSRGWGRWGRLHSLQLSAPCDIPDFKVLHPVFQGQAGTLLTNFSQSMDLLKTHVHRTHQLKYSSAEPLNAELIQQTDDNSGQNSPKLRKHLNLDPCVWTQALALISFKRVTAAA